MSIKTFKRLVLIFGIIFLVSTSAVALMIILYSGLIKEKKELENALGGAQQRVLSLKDERDMLLARLVVAESRLNTTQTSNSMKANSPVLQTDTPLNPVKHSSDIAVENFVVVAKSDDSGLRVCFKIRNMTETLQPISGTVFLILKGEINHRENWVALPSATLISGRPAHTEKGRQFSILKFIDLEFEIPLNIQGMRYATVLVFSTKGNLLLEKDYALDVNPRAISQSGMKPAGLPASPKVSENLVRPDGVKPKPERMDKDNAENVWPSSIPYSIHVESYRNRAQANKRIQQLHQLQYDCFTLRAHVPGKGYFNRIFIGHFQDLRSALQLLGQLKEKKEFRTNLHVVTRRWAVED